MPKSNTGNNAAAVWTGFNEDFKRVIPQLLSWSDDATEFRELRIKLMEDGTYLAIAKGYGDDGGEVICFGGGYGVPGAMLAINATITGGKWRVDKPWKKGGV